MFWNAFIYKFGTSEMHRYLCNAYAETGVRIHERFCEMSVAGSVHEKAVACEPDQETIMFRCIVLFVFTHGWRDHRFAACSD